MGTIKDFIQSQVLLPRLKKAGVLVVYDPARRYRALCAELADETRRVVDTTESSIRSREEALEALQALGKPQTKLEGLLVYVPAKAPLTDEERQRDPFSVYGVCGRVFPEGDGDEYMNLCLRARPDFGTEVRRIFADNPDPSFDVIDAVGGGGGWPNLQTLLKVESARDILLALLVPSAPQKKALDVGDAWAPEAKGLFQTCLGLKLTTRGKTWDSVAGELWRFVLFSEFAFDLPGPLPEALAGVPRAVAEARLLVEDLCDGLRSDQRTQARYIERAEDIERELSLPARCSGIEDLGVRDTFPFEERAVLAQAIDALQREDLDTVRQILERRKHCIWMGKGESQAQWQVVRTALALVEACEDCARQLPDHARNLEALLDYYLGVLRETDRLQREFELAAADVDVGAALGDAVGLARKRYVQLASKVQGLFIKHLEQAGWPPPGRLANADVFDRLVAPGLQESGRRTALFLIDALRYELGVALERQLMEDGKVELFAAFAQLPTMTPVGMASLLPGAGKDLRLLWKDDAVVPALGGLILANVTQRMQVFRERYGQRFQEAGLHDFAHKKVELPGTVELLVIRSNAIDNEFETGPYEALGTLCGMLRRIRVAVHKLKDLGFHEAFIVTDHGFFLNLHAGPGQMCPKPQGNWVNAHERLLLGTGAADTANFLLPAAHLGVRGDFDQVAGPRGMVAYRTGEAYFHGGVSLQEGVVPVIRVDLKGGREAVEKMATVTLSYRRGLKKITTRLPVVDVAVESEDLFTQGQDVEFLLEAQDKKGNVVGEPPPGNHVDPATGTISLKPQAQAQIPIRMDPGFEGKFTVKALDPATLTVYSKLELETDYVV